MDEQRRDERVDEVEAHLREGSTEDEDDAPTRDDPARLRGDPAQLRGDAAQKPPAAARRRRRNEDLLF